LHAFFRLAAYTGARRGELMNLRWPHVHLGDGQGEGAFVRLRGTVSVIGGVRVEGSTKGGRERTVSIDPGRMLLWHAVSYASSATSLSGLLPSCRRDERARRLN